MGRCAPRSPGIVWFLVCTRLIIPIANDGKAPFYEEFFPGFGHSMIEIVWTIIRHPSRIYRVAFLAGPAARTTGSCCCP